MPSGDFSSYLGMQDSSRRTACCGRACRCGRSCCSRSGSCTAACSPRSPSRIASLGDLRSACHEGKHRDGLSNQTSFLRPIIDGTIHAEARRRHRGRTTWVWEVEITDDDGRLCAIVRMTIAVRDAARRLTPAIPRTSACVPLRWSLRTFL